MKKINQIEEIKTKKKYNEKKSHREGPLRSLNIYSLVKIL